MLPKDDNLLFLENKIKEIKIAAFKPEIHSELQLPNNIITTIKTDSDGNIWFFTSCSGEYAKNIDKHFFSYLEYYQKGQDCRLRRSGKTSIVERDSETGASAIEKKSIINTNIVLIKFKILYAEYFEYKRPASTSIVEKVKTFIGDLFIGSNRMFDFS